MKENQCKRHVCCIKWGKCITLSFNFYFSRKISNNCSWYLALLLKRKTTDLFNLGKMF